MKAHEFITEQKLDEIERIPASRYTGGKKQLYAGDYARNYIPLPGGSGLLYTIDGLSYEPVIRLWDPNGAEADPKPYRLAGESAGVFATRMKRWEDRQKSGKRIPQLVGILTLEPPYNLPIKKALQVETITVHEDYRGVGLAKALYGIVLTIMKRTLVAGDSQTPGGRKNWVSLSQIPGVEMKGYVSISDGDLDTDPKIIDNRVRKNAEKNIDLVMGKLGGQYIGESGYDHVFAFDVLPTMDAKELKAAVKQKMVNVYRYLQPFEVGLYATWTGQ